MKIRSIRAGVLFLSFVLLLNSFCFAKEVAEEETVKSVMTLSEAVDYALKHNSNVVDISRKEKDQKKLYDNARDTYRAWKNKLRSGGYSFDTVTDYLDCWGYSYEMADLTYKSFLSTKKTAEETVKYNVKKIAYSIDELEKSIECLEKTIEKQENDVKIAKVKNELNMITVLDVESAKITLNSTKLQLDSLKTTLESLRVNLKNLMGYDIQKELTVIIPEEEFKILDIEDLSKAIDNSMETNASAIAAKISYKQKEINNILATKTHLLESSEDIKEAKKEFSDAELRLNNSLNFIKENLYSLHNQIKSNEESTIIAKREYEQLKIKYDQMKLMYELGMVSKHDFNSYEIALINARNTYESALHENILLNERWNVAMSVGDVLG